MVKQGKEKKQKIRMRLLAVVVSFCLLITTCPCMLGGTPVYAAVIKSGYCGANGSNVIYSLDDSGTLTISGSGAIKDSVQYSEWSDIRDTVKRVVIGKGVTQMGDYAFCEFTSLKSIEIPDGVKAIDDYAFYNCSALASIKIPDSVTEIGSAAFRDCSVLASIKIPNNVTEIGSQAFAYCKALKSVDIPKKITRIGTATFVGCSALETVKIPEGVTSIERMAFWNCSSLETVTIPSSVKTIGYEAFSACRLLKSVEMSTGVTDISNNAFMNCSALETVIIPDSVVTVGEFAFVGCSNAVIYYPDTAMFGEDWNRNTTASISYTANNGEADLSITACSKDLTELHVPAMVCGERIVSLNYEDYPNVAVTHDGPHNFNDDICRICGEESEEKKVADAKQVVEEALEKIEATNATTREEIQTILDAALEEAGISSDDVTVTVADFNKTEATKYEGGSILGKVSIVSVQDANVRDSVDVDLYIEELITNEEMVADAKAFVERVLAGITATNDITREQIQTIIDEALDDEEYIYDVEITVGVLTKTEADMMASGSIMGAVSIVSENDDSVRDSVPVDLTIAKLPAPVTNIILNRENVVLTREGETIQLIADVVPEFADNKTVIWSSNNAEVATVDATGKVTAVGNGTCAVTVTTEDGGKIATCQISVNIPVITPVPVVTPSPVITPTPIITPTPVITPSPVKTPVLSETPVPSKTSEPGKTTESDKTNKLDSTASAGIVKKVTLSKKAPISNIAFLYGGLKVRQKGRKIVISWGRAAGADGYDVYVQYCGKNFTAKSIKSIRSGTKTKITVTKINGKALNLKKHFKLYVFAYKWVNGKKVKIGRTVAAHVVGSKAAKYTNARAIRLRKNSYRLKKGESVRLKPSTVLASKSRKQLSDAHTKEFRYATDNKKVATVSGEGKIKAVGMGSCIIYVYARNGYTKKLKVTVG